MSSICFFASYFEGPELPYYIKVYLKELRRHFDETILLCSGGPLSLQSIEFLKTEGIQWRVEENEGFDFGLWFKAFGKFDLNLYDRVALVNDSCVLLRPLNTFMEWSASNGADFQGMTASEAISPHLQSYFLLLKKTAIPYAKIYFEQNGLQKTIGEVISVYEVGLSKYLLSKGLKMAAYVDNGQYRGEFSPYYHCINYHLKKGIPLIKKKILFASYREDEMFTLARMNFNINPAYYANLIKSLYHDLLLEPNELIKRNGQKIDLLPRIKYEFTRRSIFWLKKLIK